MKRSRSLKDILVIGGALFAMFFGAGNLIFPPALGLQCGRLWWLGFLFYFLADLGIGVVAIIAMGRLDGKAERVTEPLGRIPSTLISVLIILAIGPGLAIPRTAATTYELGIAPLLGIGESHLARALVSLVFFAIVLALTFRPGAVVDLIGKILTPVLLVTLVVLIIKGALSPAELSDPPAASEVIKDGVYNGYQTLDMLGAVLFSILIINSIRDKGYEDTRSIRALSLRASLIAALLIFFVYGGLAYLGAGSGSAYSGAYASGTMNQAGLLAAIIRDILGPAGTVIQAVVVASACLTTAVGLTSAAAQFFNKLSRGKLSYKAVAIAVCAVSAVTCNLGLSAIISIAAPILMVLYPLNIVMIITAFVRGTVRSAVPYRLSAAVTLLLSMIDVAGETFGIAFCKTIIEKLPLSAYGFSWLIPAALAFAVGMIPAASMKRGKIHSSGKDPETAL